MRALRRLIVRLRLTPEERGEAGCEQCMEALYDAERPPILDLGEREQAAIETQRRRWSQVRGPLEH